MDILHKQKFIFSRLFLLSNKLQTAGDKVLAEEMTMRQWLLTVAIAQFGGAPPTLGEVAALMESSHQNVKLLAVKLQERGFIHMTKDKEDQRVTRLILAEKSCSFWEKRQVEVRNFLAGLFRDLGKDEIDTLYDGLNKLYENILKMRNEIENQERVF